MPSQTVIEKLEKLQTELDKVSEAVKHIDYASKVAKTAADILEKIPKLLADLKSIEETHRKDLLKAHKEKIDAIGDQLQLLLAELKDKAKQLNQVIEETKKLENAIKDYIVELRNINFPERLSRIDNQISSINIGVGNLQTSIQQSQEKITNDVIKHLTEETQLLKKEIKTNRIIQIVGLTIILAILIYIATKY